MSHDVGIVGAGAWGRALHLVLSNGGLDVALGARGAEGTASNAPIVIFCVPTAAMREVAERTAPNLGHGTIVVSAAKGFEPETDRTMTQMLQELFPENPLAALSGPNLAAEIMRGSPAATVIASSRQDMAEHVRDICSGPQLRWYSSADVIGVEYAGALKNVIAIAAGVCDGIGVGDNGKAAIITRGLAEIARLGVRAGAKALTFAGLAGVGDCFATCMSPLSRNRSFGEAVARGTAVDAAVATLGTVEGLGATRAAIRLAAKFGVEIPIAQAINDVVFNAKPVREALVDLTNRDPADELPI